MSPGCIGGDRSGGIREDERASCSFGGTLPPSNVHLQLVQLFLESLTKDIDIVGSAVVDTPYEQSRNVDAACIPVPEPDGGWDHGRERKAVLNQHEGRFLQCLRQAQDKSSNPGLGL